MNNTRNIKVTIDQLLLKTLYYRYRAFVTPLVVILVCLLLFWFLVIPQIQAFYAMKDSLTLDTQNLSVLHQNLKIITNLDSAKLNQTLTTATDALPSEKDFAGIVSTLSNAAVSSGVILQDYSFTLGDLSGFDQNGKLSETPTQVTVNIVGDVYAADRFMKQLSTQLPLSDVVSLTLGSGSSASLSIVFYYAPIQKIAFDNTVPLPVLTANDAKMLDSLGVPISGNVGNVASTSATPILIPSPIITKSATSSSKTIIATQSAK